MIICSFEFKYRMILIHSNVSKFYKKQHTNMPYCFSNRPSLDWSTDSMDESFFLKKTDVARFVERLFHLTTIEEQSKDWGNINPEYFSKSYK